VTAVVSDTEKRVNGRIRGGIFLLCCGLFQVGSSQELPPFIQQIIAEHEEALPEPDPDRALGAIRVRTSALEIWQYDYLGETVFYFPTTPGDCCDTFSRLYDVDGNLICYPDGGITGKGDGRCPGFVDSRGRGVRIHGGFPSDGQPGEDGDTDSEAR